jgi:alpha-tubulin suppressor-like RCC1 family protein
MLAATVKRHGFIRGDIMVPSKCYALFGSLLLVATLWMGTPKASAQGDTTKSTPDAVRKVVGSHHFLALMANGSVMGWGRHRDGQLGEQAYLITRRRYGVAMPVSIPLPGPAIDIAVGTASSYALLADGSVWAWGRGYDGELGLGPAARKERLANGEPGIATPQRIPELQDIVQISVHEAVAHALRKDGALFAWGSRDGGAIGDGLVPPRWGESVAVADRPVQVPLPGQTRVAKLGIHTVGMIITSDGRVLQWPTPRGPAKEGDVWQPLNTAVLEVPLPGPAIDIASVGGASLALLRDGTVWVWGYNMQGLWGNGERADTNDPERWRQIPKPVPGIRQAVALATGTIGRHALVLLPDGSLRGWGNSDWGQIGAGVDGDSQLKAVTPKISGVLRVWAGGNNSFALTRDGRFWSWGSKQNGEGLLGTQSKIPVAWPPSMLQPP